ncbi:pyrroline-5-carboxylate reductase [Leptospira perolatii]|uniref:Pyrroline-5-carboxylate reductase n=1 Tax=Leptospira perolatii TaxID=2023191 RepID=A0A2M9ZL33_9LEPT|nr:pyrroline-5-carboxylate reductase [Leptospira perolatii]PJZ70324.1 pyrroline-5-carboxylate reductase [Leptospira perolatii]PJZ72792.1 pyrroline-5-carboxylate reductase [Leptospira perolatii]
MSESIGIIGCGNMGGAIYNSLQERKEKVFGYDPYLSQSKQAKIDLESDWNEFLKKSEILILAVKPNEVSKILKSLNSSKKILSVAAGIDTHTLRNASPPGSQVVRIMPNLPLLVGAGALGYFGEKELYELVQKIFSPISYCLEVSKEELLDAVTGLSGSGPAYVLKFIQSLAEGGVSVGLTYAQSLELSLQTVLGTTKLFLREREANPDSHPEALKNRVTSPGGTTIAGLEALEQGAFSHSVISAVKRATERSKELGR